MKSNRRPRSANIVIGDDVSTSNVNGPSSSFESESRKSAAAANRRAAQAPATSIEELTKQLELMTKSRDELQRDVESLCMQQSSSIFDSSMVLSERLFSAERDSSRYKSQLAGMTEERNHLKEDLRGHRDAKSSVEKSWKAERSRAEKLDKELQFYQAQSTRAMTDRDRATWEAEELRRESLKLREQVDKATTRLDSMSAEHADLSAQLLDARERLEILQDKAKDCERIPALLHDIEESSREIAELKASRSSLQASLKAKILEADKLSNMYEGLNQVKSKLEVDLQDAESKSHSARKQATTEITRLEARIVKLEEANIALDMRVEEAEGNSAASQAALESAAAEQEGQLRAVMASHSQQLTTVEASYAVKLGDLEKAVKDNAETLGSMTSQFEQVTGEKVQALMRASQAEQTAEQAFEETGNLLAQIADIKQKLTQATQEKVAALMQVASLKESLRTAGKASPSQQAKSTGWRIWGAASPTVETDHSEINTTNALEPASSPLTQPSSQEICDKTKSIQSRV